MSDINIPSDFSVVQNNYILEIRNLIDDMSGIKFLASVANTNNITIPEKNDLVSFIQGNQLFDILNTIENTFGKEKVVRESICVSVTPAGGGTATNSGFNSSDFCKSVINDPGSPCSSNAHGRDCCSGWSTGNCTIAMGFGFDASVDDSYHSNNTVESSVGSGGGTVRNSGFRSTPTFSTYFGSAFAVNNTAVEVAGFCINFQKGV